MGAVLVVRGLARRAREGSVRRRETGGALDAARGALAPGVWVPVGRIAWKRLGGRVPPHFRSNPRARGGRSRRATALTARQPAPEPAPRRGTLSVLQDLADGLLPPWFRFVSPHRSGELPGGYSIALPTAPIGSGRIVLLDPDGGRVLRVTGAPLDAGYLDLRRRLEGHVRVARMLRTGATWFEEELVRGEEFATLSDEAQRRAIRRLFGAMTALVAAEARPGPTDEDRRWSDRLSTMDRPAWFDRLLGGASIDALLRDGPVVPIHGDIGGHNLLLVDGEPVLFDVDPRMLRPGPFWFDLVHWMHPRVPLPHRAWFRAGVFDEEVAALCRAAGWTDAAPAALRDRLSALLIGRTFVEEHPETGRDPAADRAHLDALGRTLEVVG